MFRSSSLQGGFLVIEGDKLTRWQSVLRICTLLSDEKRSHLLGICLVSAFTSSLRKSEAFSIAGSNSGMATSLMILLLRGFNILVITALTLASGA